MIIWRSLSPSVLARVLELVLGRDRPEVCAPAGAKTPPQTLKAPRVGQT
jgi:hypothetical protein